MAKGKQEENFCTNCGFMVVTDYVYVSTCPICGMPLTKRKPPAKTAADKKRAKEQR